MKSLDRFSGEGRGMFSTMGLGESFPLLQIDRRGLHGFPAPSWLMCGVGISAFCLSWIRLNTTLFWVILLPQGLLKQNLTSYNSELMDSCHRLYYCSLGHIHGLVRASDVTFPPFRLSRAGLGFRQENVKGFKTETEKPGFP